MHQPVRVQAGAGADEEGRQLVFALGGLVAWQGHEHRRLADARLVAAHAVVARHQPPAFLDVPPPVRRAIEVVLGESRLGAAQQKANQRVPVRLHQVRRRHAQALERLLDLTLVEDGGVGELVLQETLVVVPVLALGVVGQQGEVQTVNGFAALEGELGADAAFFFEAGDFVAAGAAVVADPEAALVFELGIFHPVGLGIGGGGLLLLGHQVAGDVAGVFPGEPPAGHHRAGLELEQFAVVRAGGVVGVEDEREPAPGVVVGSEVAFLLGAVGAGALARIVNPAHQEVVVRLLAHAAQVGGEGAADGVLAFAERVAGQAAAGLKKLLAARGGAAGLGRQAGPGACLPEVGGEGAQLVVLQTEARHLGRRAPLVGVLEPHGNPVAAELDADLFQVGPGALLFLHQAGHTHLELLALGVQPAHADAEVFGVGVEPLGGLVGVGGVAVLDALLDLALGFGLFAVELVDGLAGGFQALAIVVEAFEAVAAHAAAQAEELLAAVQHLGLLDHHVAGVALLAAGLEVLAVVERPEPVLVAAVGLDDAGGGAAVAAVTGRTAEALRFVNLQELAAGVARENFFAAQVRGGEANRLAGAVVAGVATGPQPR